MRRLVVLLLAVAALILLVAQLALPSIATDRISSRVGRYGVLERVSVSAWPAIELLWGSADSSSVRAKRLRLSPSQAARLLWEARGVDKLELTASEVQVGPLRLSDARLHKRGSSLAAEAVISEADVKAALPPGLSVSLLGSEAGVVKVTASGGLFGGGPTVTAIAGPSEGRLVVHPTGSALEGVRLTLFADRHVHVDGVGAGARPGSPRSYRLTMTARLR
jgi:DUF2993 family protein